MLYKISSSFEEKLELEEMIELEQSICSKRKNKWEREEHEKKQPLLRRIRRKIKNEKENNPKYKSKSNKKN